MSFTPALIASQNGITLKNNRLDSLQVSRAIAAFLVVLYHLSLNSKIFLGYNFLHSLFLFGHNGVTFFFVLSGFIISYSHWDDIGGGYQNFAKYAFRRVTRIFPGYWPILILVTFFYIYFSKYSYDHDYKVHITWSLFLKNFFLISYNQNPIVLVAWTLQYEMLFYLIFSTLIISSDLGISLLIVWFISIFFVNLGYFDTSSSSFIHFVCSYCSAQFLIGCCATFILRKWMKYIYAPKFILGIGVLGFLLNGIIEDHYFTQFNTTYRMALNTTYSFLIILSLVKIESIKKIQCSQWLVFLGAASYSMYLIHPILLSILFRCSQYIGGYQFPHIRFVFLAIIILLTCLAVPSLYYRLYELPMMNYLRAKFKKSTLIDIQQQPITW